MRTVISALKLTGALTLGILTGIHLNFSLDTIQAILSVGSASQAQRAFVTALGLLRGIVRPLELLAATALLSAYSLSPSEGRHPYLLIATGGVAASWGIEKLKLGSVEYGVRSVETLDREEMVEVNGEVVRGGLERWRSWGLWRGGAVGMGFVLSVVGVYGDRYHN